MTILGVGTGLAILTGVFMARYGRRHPRDRESKVPLVDREARVGWRMPPLVLLTRPRLRRNGGRWAV